MNHSPDAIYLSDLSGNLLLSNRRFRKWFGVSDVTGTSDGTGTGLGLSTSYGFVRQSGGHVTLESQPGEGTTIKLYLPRSEKTAEASSPGKVANKPLQGHGELVMVVEDDPRVRELATAQLAKLNYRSVDFETAMEAIEYLESNTVDAIVTDVVLPGGMNGPQLARKIALEHPEVKIILMSGYVAGALPDADEIHTLGPLLQKPFTRQVLASTLRRVLDQQTSEQRYKGTA